LISKLQNNLQSGSAIRYLPIGYLASNSSKWKIYRYIRQNCDDLTIPTSLHEKIMRKAKYQFSRTLLHARFESI